MKFKIAADLLKACISSIEGGLGVMSFGERSIKIDVGENEVKFYTNNIRIGYVVSVNGSDIQIIEKGSVVVLGLTLKRFVMSVMDDIVTLYDKDSYLVIKDKNRETKIGTLDVEDFIEPELCTEFLCKVNLPKLQSMIKSAIYSSATNNSIIDSVYIDGKIVGGTDSNKATIIPFVIDDLVNPIILTRDACREILKQNYTEDIYLMTNGSFITIYLSGETQSLSLTCQLLAGSYPDLAGFYKKIQTPKKLSVSLMDFFNEINYVSLISESKEQNCVMEVKDNSLHFLAFSEDGINSVSSSIKCKSSDEDFKFNFKISKMSSLVRALIEYVEAYGIDADVMTIKYKDIESPIKIELEGADIYELLSALRL